MNKLTLGNAIKGSWVTSVFGVLLMLRALLGAAVGVFELDSLNLGSLVGVAGQYWEAFLAGLGFLMAKDGNKSSEELSNGK